MEDLKKSIQYLKGIGPKKFQYLNKINIKNIEDVLYNFPREYEDRGTMTQIKNITVNEKTILKVKIAGPIQEKAVKRGLKIYKVPIKDDTGNMYAVFYNVPFLKNILHIGKSLVLYGKVQRSFDQLQIIHPEYTILDEKQEDVGMNKIRPMYSLTNGITQNDISKLSQQVLDTYKDSIKEFLPDDTRKLNRLCDIQFALSNIHFPLSIQDMKIAKFRLVFEELFLLQLGLWLIKIQMVKNNNGIRFIKKNEVDQFVKSLPFELTQAQKKVLEEIQSGMENNKPMNRLVQGDVGSGKTIIAIIALYQCVLNGYQGALMAPTEILAEQHYEAAYNLLEKLGIRVALLTGSIHKKKKEGLLDQLKSGEIDIIIGTHAVIQENVAFEKLGLVITDEQHRFGVRQRGVLASKGCNPDVVVMTATPIPRTLALILYGDLDISIIDELPPGRKKIKTYCVAKAQRERVYNFIKKEIELGRQVYIVAPLVENSEKIEALSATDIYIELKESYLNEYEIGLLHGKMKPHEKEEIMQKFKQGELQVLVATTVIEVGVNVPNASTMIIENSERFGLAQLHQLRGRVGRGEYQSYCILINYSKSAIAKERMKIMESTSDGFIIAEKDLELRGPGEFFGTSQHGLPELKIANLFKHMRILKQAQKEAKRIMDEDPMLILEKNRELKYKIIEKFGKMIEDICL
ncbi:ATP-dependent DNA helicase RecG [Lutibacter sp. B2]|nr:ATP-dependent DNA helicase RecG [Lutibacter sp. B2]